ncbi:MAG: hypothetical protein HUJ61_06595 [Bacilli bacterium]|nr:hypothetical protein [Bacilli bacterium]
MKIKSNVILLLIAESLALLATLTSIPAIAKITALSSTLAFLALAGLIITIIALCRLRKVSGHFTVALWIVIASLILETVGLIISAISIAGETANKTLQIVGSSLILLATISTVFDVYEELNGFNQYLESNGYEKKAAYTKSVLWIYGCMVAIYIICNLALFINSIAVNEQLALALSIAAVVAMVVAEIVYIVYLARLLKNDK